MVGVIARIKVKADQVDTFKGVFKGLMADVRANEPGNVYYELFQAKDDPTQFTVMEMYVDQDSLTAHGATEHFRAAGPKLGPCLDGPPKIEYLNKA
ncbi:MAG: antibiotic biosynthesis monooxygenase [Alphaproteobacteria bacterium]|nr:antibiotic biosynthesis monooxygenase [Alphaproteobacteria bacterium]